MNKIFLSYNFDYVFVMSKSYPRCLQGCQAKAMTPGDEVDNDCDGEVDEEDCDGKGSISSTLISTLNILYMKG